MASVASSWQAKPQWRILDTEFARGFAFFSTCNTWLNDAQRPHTLHYVALTRNAPSASFLVAASLGNPFPLALAHQLASQWRGITPGFHRFLLAQGQIILTLCVGDTLPLLRQQKFLADALLLHPSTLADPTSQPTERLWIAKALANGSRRGTIVQFLNCTEVDRAAWCADLHQCGFQDQQPHRDDASAVATSVYLHFAPPWTLKRTRSHTLAAPLPVQRCAVVGGGLAGASVAATLARRGWQVRVLDRANHPAAGASGLPVGLVVPHVSSDDCSVSRLSRAGVRLMLQQAHQLLCAGQDWAPSGVLERQVKGTPQLPAIWPHSGHEWSTAADTAKIGSLAATCAPALWHPQGAWIKPAALVHAWLRQPGVTFQGNSAVTRLRRTEGLWELLGQDGVVLCRAERVVLANACGARTVLQTLAADDPTWQLPLGQLPASQGMRGLLSWGMRSDTASTPETFVPFPVNGSGSVVGSIPWREDAAWFVGSSYQPASQPERPDVDNHVLNFERLQKLLPNLANHLRSQFDRGSVQAWKGVRCVMADRLPVVGPLDAGEQPSLWICAGLGSRGLSFSVLCAELLAARMGAEPLPVEAKLAKLLNALRT